MSDVKFVVEQQCRLISTPRSQTAGASLLFQLMGPNRTFHTENPSTTI